MADPGAAARATLTFDRGGGQALLTIVLSAVVASAVAGLTRWARAVAAERAWSIAAFRCRDRHSVAATPRE